ncbi:MAG: hypothetical protein MH204_01220, partial [Fimbriimonadaceae bacterium]|nr:hypothetical protein [Fimbriimonadaceae bacterium]
TFTSQMVQGNSQIFQSVAAQVPTAREAPRPEAPPEERAPRVVPAAYIGPADFIFSMAFFACLFRLRMKVRETVRWLIPVLVFYLGLVFFTPFGMLPALVPIGLTVLIVNAREFTMTRDEKLGVWIVSVVSVALAVLGVWQRVNYVPPKPPAEPSIQAPGPEGPAPEASPEPAAPGPLPS